MGITPKTCFTVLARTAGGRSRSRRKPDSGDISSSTMSKHTSGGARTRAAIGIQANLSRQFKRNIHIRGCISKDAQAQLASMAGGLAQSLASSAEEPVL